MKGKNLTCGRKRYIDVAKGIGIILVVLGHLDKNGQISREMIYAFHMPLFFLLSGAFSKTDIDFKSYFKKSFLSLYLPYFIFVAVDTVIVTALALIENQSVSAGVKSNFFALFGFDYKVLNRPLWFLFALFVIKIAFYFINKRDFLKYSALVLSVGFVFVSQYVHMPDNCLWTVAVAGLAFYIVGSVLGKHILSMDVMLEGCGKNKALVYAVTALLDFGLLAAFAFTAHKNGAVDMTIYRYGSSAFLYFVNAVIGCLAVLLLSLVLSKIDFVSKFFCFYGENSMAVMICHYYLTRKLLPVLMEHWGLKAYLYHPLTQAAVLVIVIAAIIPVIALTNRYCSFLFGKLPKNKKLLIKKSNI